MELSTQIIHVKLNVSGDILENYTVLSTVAPLAPQHNPFSVDPETYWYVNLVNAAILGQVFALFGMGTNLINIVVFVKMGFKDPVNITLLGLAISDFLSCLPLLWMNLTRTPGFTELELTFEPFGIGYITGSWPHFVMVKVTSWLTTFITLERCLCVVFPLKIKEMMTPRKVAIITVSLYLFVFIVTVPTFNSHRFDDVFYPNLNKSLVSLVVTKYFVFHEIERTTFAIFGIFMPFASFFSTVVFTIILVYALRKSASFRKKATTTAAATSGSDQTGSQRASSRDIKVCRMVTLLSALFIACFTPIMICTIFVMAVPQFQAVNATGNIMFLIFSFIYLLETTNSSLNIFVYYHRSSNYKATFNKLFRLSKADGKGTKRV